MPVTIQLANPFGRSALEKKISRDIFTRFALYLHWQAKYTICIRHCQRNGQIY